MRGPGPTKSWQQLRAYLNVFEEYFTYLSVRQKTQALSFLYELLMHREGDIRRQAGALIWPDYRPVPPGLPQGGPRRRPE